MHFDLAQVISLLVGVVLPLLTGLMTKTSTSAGFKAVVLLALSAVSAVLADFLAALNGGLAFDLGATLLTALGTFLIGVGMHFGIWKPTGVAAGLQRVGSGV